MIGQKSEDTVVLASRSSLENLNVLSLLALGAALHVEADGLAFLQ